MRRKQTKVFSSTEIHLNTLDFASAFLFFHSDEAEGISKGLHGELVGHLS